MSDIKQYIESHCEDEEPIVVVESSRPNDSAASHTTVINIHDGSKRRWVWMVVSIVVASLLVVCSIVGYWYWRRYVEIGVPVSVTPEQNIAVLQQQVPSETSEVLVREDSILGVKMRMYELRGLRAEISFQEPDTTDTGVYLYSRCADHTAEGQYLGSLVVEGRLITDDNNRLGYFAAIEDRMVIGISRSEKVRDFCVERGGQFFRQFILVSNGVIPPRFYLHGKVERRAIGRIGSRLFYIEAPNKETMWDFADALREAGFTDAIYITGGNDYSYYRTADGTRHDISSPDQYPHTKWKGIIPWLVFRKR